MYKYIKSDMNPRYNEYLDYLCDHISNVNRSWRVILRPYLMSRMALSQITSLDRQIDIHDTSKYDYIEFIPYLNHFYPHKDYPDDSLSYDMAWLHHQKFNPHHWQYYVLVKDSGEVEALDMPFESIVEMLCDWHSFSYTDLGNTAYQWYINNNDKMILSKNTIQILDNLITLFK